MVMDGGPGAGSANDERSDLSFLHTDEEVDVRRVLALLLAVGLAGAAGCATTGSGGGGSDRGDVITSQQLRDVQNQYNNLLSVVRNLAPGWLQTRGTASINVENAKEPVVFVDGNRFGSGQVETLRSLSPSQVQEVQYLNAREATTRHGTGYTGGIILVRTRAGA